MNQADEDAALMRELDVIGDRKRGITGVFPVSRSEWRAGEALAILGAMDMLERW